MNATSVPEVIAEEIVTTGNVGLAGVLADALADSGQSEEWLVGLQQGDRFALAHRCMGLLKVAVTYNTTNDRRSHRLRTRTVDVDRMIEWAASIAVLEGTAVGARHGGGVANKYGYPAQTEGALVGAVYDHSTRTVTVKVWAGELPANKVTLRGVAEMWGYGDLYDGRVSEKRRAECKARLLADVVS